MRFVLSNRHQIQETPLQVYLSALVFAPTKSGIWQAYSHELPQWLTRLPQMPEEWSEEWLCLKGHFRSVTAVACSPDNQLLALGSAADIRLWDCQGDNHQHLPTL
jgi:WD40 repeat protein